MITNDEIYKLAASKLTVQGVEIPCINGVLGFADAIIALARQVKPLEFARGDDGDLLAHCSYGVYIIMPVVGNPGIYELFIGRDIPQGIDEEMERFSSEQYAVEIAQDIHKAKILRELVHGSGGNG